MPKFELKEGEVQGVLAFLSRASLAGSEVPAFNKIVNIFKNPIEEKKEDPKA